jgi:hypothetical protein
MSGEGCIFITRDLCVSVLDLVALIDLVNSLLSRVLDIPELVRRHDVNLFFLPIIRHMIQRFLEFY